MPGYDFMRTMYTRRIYPNVESNRNSIRVLTLTNEKFGRLKAEDLVDDRIVRKLEREGAAGPAAWTAEDVAPPVSLRF